MRRIFNLSLGLEADEPMTTVHAHSAVFHLSEHVTGFPELDPAEAGGQFNPAAFERAVFVKVDKANAVAGFALFLEPGPLGIINFLEIPLPSGIQVFEFLLQVVGVGFRQPFGVRVAFPEGYPFRHAFIARHVCTVSVRRFIAQRQGLIPYKPGMTAEHAQAGALRLAGVQSVFEALSYDHEPAQCLYIDGYVGFRCWYTLIVLYILLYKQSFGGVQHEKS